MSLYSDMKMILSLKFSGSHQILNLFEEAQRCDTWEYFPLELRRHTIDSMHILVARIPNNFVGIGDHLPFPTQSAESEKM